MRTFDPNDPRLTAYALGELHGSEAAEIEAALEADDSLRAEVEKIRQVGSMLRGGFAAEHAPTLTDQQRQSITRQPQPAGRALAFRGRTIWLSAGLAAAACLTIALVLTFSQSTDRIARVDERSPRSQITNDELNGQRFSAAKEKIDEQAGRRATTTLNDGAVGVSKDADGSPRLKLNQDAAKPESFTFENSLLGGRSALGTDLDRKANPVPSGPSPQAPGARRIRAAYEPESDGSSRPDSPAPPGQATASRAVVDGTSVPASPPVLITSPPTAPREQQTHFFSYPVGFAGGDNHPHFVENPFLNPTEQPQSTFSIDVDTASYSIVRRHLMEGRLPPTDAVRIEEMINYFPYRYEPPSGETPFSANIEVNQAPWNPQHRLVRIGLKGKEIKPDMRPPTSLVFLIDVSGSMADQKKLPLVKQSMKLLVEHLNADDRLAIVTYAGQAGLVMDSTYCTPEKKAEISRMIESLNAGGSTNGSGGIQVAYAVASQYFIKGGVNRVILCTDGDFNVGASSEADLIRLIEDKRATGVYLSVLGFGSGNLQDAKMKQLSKHGNGNYAFIDAIDEGRKVLVDQLSGTLVPIAKDVKVQVEFNPALVGAYRLIGYEQRLMAAQDFNDDRKDAGEIGAGHSVTALYEIIPPGPGAQTATAPPVDELKYQKIANEKLEIVPSDELLTVKLRYKPIDAEGDGPNARVEFAVKDSGARLETASTDFKFAAAVAGFGLILRDSAYKGNFDAARVMELAQSAVDDFRMESASEFLDLVQRARMLMQAAPNMLKE